MPSGADRRPLTALKNIGPTSARRLEAAGIADAGALRALGAVAAYGRVKHMYPRVTTAVMLYALAGALADRHWNRLPVALVRRLRVAAGLGREQSPTAPKLSRRRSPG